LPRFFNFIKLKKIFQTKTHFKIVEAKQLSKIGRVTRGRCYDHNFLRKN
jgi:hypothetical protein